MTLTVTIPIITVSESNQHTHWRQRQRRAKAQRQTTREYLWEAIAGSAWSRVFPLVVTLTRISPRLLDDDNLQGSQKHVRDGVADFLGIDDRDQRITWQYAQKRGKIREYAVEILVAPHQGG